MAIFHMDLKNVSRTQADQIINLSMTRAATLALKPGGMKHFALFYIR